jgi:hypothetical protein
VGNLAALPYIQARHYTPTGGRNVDWLVIHSTRCRYNKNMANRTLSPDATEKRCPRCCETKSLEDFHRSSRTKDGRQVYCKPCQGTAWKAWRQGNPDRTREYDRTHNRKRKPLSPEQRQARRAYRLQWRYGLSIEEFDALLEQQDGTCAICPVVISDGSGRRLHVDHDHDTGKVRGLLCQKCNTALGAFGESPERLRKALAYLERQGP